MNRDIIKLLAIIAMTVNHIALTFIPMSNPFYTIMVDIGYFTAITMCYFLVEGYFYTHSKSAYLKRLLLFGSVSQVPYTLTFGTYQLNMIITLSICLLMLIVIDCKKSVEFKIVLLSCLTALTIYYDWSVEAATFTVLFRLTYKRNKLLLAYIFSFVLHLVLAVCRYYETNGSFNGSILYSAGTTMGIAVSGMVILKLYNGRKSKKFQAFWKWLFYSYYPLHLIVLCIFARNGGVR